MADVTKMSDRVIEYAERASAMAEAAQGKKSIRSRGLGRWLLLPAAGAGLYAMVRSGAVSRRARGAVNEAMTKAAELPDDLLSRVRQTPRRSTQRSASRNGATRRQATSARRRRTTARAKSSSR
jgi:hypothetical protein